ncbi:CBS domain-containing protein, partial [Bacteroides thetaiotaomicron]
MQVRDLMSQGVVSITPGESAALAARLLSRHNVGSLPVCGEDGRLRGIVTDRDIVLRCVAAEEDPSKVPVRDIMSRNCAVVSPNDAA